MKIRSLHPWDLPPAEAIALQKRLAADIRLEPMAQRTPRLIAGVDVSSTKWSPLLTAGIVVWDSEQGAVIDAAHAQMESVFPYIPGLLSFREIPVLALAIDQLTTVPDAMLVDGQGIAHPRRLGIASHLGLLVDCPTVGVGKSKLCGDFTMPADTAGAREPLIHHNETIGTVLRTKPRAKPLFISPGNRITLEESVALVRSCSRGYRLPEPTRLAHVYVNAKRRGEPMPILDTQEQPSLL
jgi:deoxyribonuclease V